MKTHVCGREYLCEDFGQNFRWTLTGEEKEGVTTLSLTLDFKGKLRPKKTALSFSLPALGADGCWSACGGVNRVLTPDWGPFTVNSRSVAGMPVLSILSEDDVNVLTASLSDAETPCALKAGYREEDSLLAVTLEWFLDVTESMTGYRAQIVIDERRLPFYECVKEASGRLRKKYGAVNAPPAAHAPAFSTWYCFHQNLEYERILKECRAARDLGLETVIIDDGWHTTDNSRGFGYCGDYRPQKEKVGDIRLLTKEIHSLGLKAMLWYSVAFSGDFSAQSERFRPLSLYHDGAQNACVLDPRFPQVREHIWKYCEEAIGDWDFDGLKLDFIDSFRLTQETAERAGINCESLEEGIRRLTEGLKEKLVRIKPDVLIEFSQAYIGPSMQSLGNMLRVGDCPGSSLQNRVGTIDLRLIAGGAAVHSDPLEWNEKETPENIARAFINVIFSTVQFSVYPSKLTEAQRAVCERYIRFIKEYRSVLQAGEFYPCGVLHNYLAATAAGENKEVTAIFSDTCVRVKNKEAVLLNAGGRYAVIAELPSLYRYRIEDCMGKSLFFGTASGLASLPVPVGGIAFLTAV